MYVNKKITENTCNNLGGDGAGHVTRYKPNDPEFAAVAAQITPVEMVHKESYRKVYIEAEQDLTYKTKLTRRESVNKMR